MPCKRCGQENDPEAYRCIRCGEALREPPTGGPSHPGEARTLSEMRPPSEPPPPSSSPPPFPTTPAAIPSGAVPTPEVPNYLIPAILATILCCLPTGIVSIVYAAQANARKEVQDYAAAARASNKAKLWFWASVLIGIMTYLIYMVFFVLGILRSH